MTSQKESIEAFEQSLSRILAEHPFATEPLAFAIRRVSPDLCRILLNLNLSEKSDASFPPIEEISAAQCTLFDNWPNGTKPKTINGKREKGARSERYKAVVEVWTLTGSSEKLSLTAGNAAYVGKANLSDAPSLTRAGRKLVAADASEPMQDFVIEMLAPSADDKDRRAGPLRAKLGGTAQIGTYVTTSARDLDLRKSSFPLTVNTPSGSFVFQHWTSTYSSGAPLKGNAVLTCRWSKLDQKAWWTTEPKA